MNIVQWFKNGDHPEDYSRDLEGIENNELRVYTGIERKENGWEGDIVRYYRHPYVEGDQICIKCKCEMNEHGWIDNESKHPHCFAVCPGDFIIEIAEHVYYNFNSNDIMALQYIVNDMENELAKIDS